MTTSFGQDMLRAHLCTYLAAGHEAGTFGFGEQVTNQYATRPGR